MSTAQKPSLTDMERSMRIDRAARQAAVAALCHVVHLNGYEWTDEQFDAHEIGLRNIIAKQLHRIDGYTVSP